MDNLISPDLIKKERFYFLVILLISYRFFHFGASIDLPHDWRQCDTAYYIQDFYENGIDLLSPAVCWMGNYENLALEFPLPEAIVTATQFLFGNSMGVSRSVFLLFFIFGVYYFYKVVQVLFGLNTARWSCLIYLSLPLSLFYSRAIHIDFFALAVAHAMLYYCLLGIRRQSFVLLIVASAWAVLAFLVKPPYVFYLALPLLVYTWREEHLKWLLSRAWIFVFPLLAFWWWQQHAYLINHSAPNWDYILNYRKFDHNNHWYFGSLEQRLSLYNWKKISLRLILEVGGGLGLLLAYFGMVRKEQHSNAYFIWWWLVGLLIYLLVFFNLNLFHNYYQLPFLAIVSLAASLGIIRLGIYGRKWMYLAFVLLVSTSIVFAEYTYYEKAVSLEKMGETIQNYTDDNALIIVTYKNFDCRNPRLLFRADRKGWSIEKNAATPAVLEKLHTEEGARYWAYFGNQIPKEIPSIPNTEFQKILLNLPYPDSDINLYLYQWSK